MDHRLTMLQMKSELLDLWSEDAVTRSFEEWSEILKQKLQDYFGIEKLDFLIYGDNGFAPLRKYLTTWTLSEEASSWSIEKNSLEFKERYLQVLKEQGFPYADDLLFFMSDEIEPLGLLLIQSTESWRTFANSPYRAELEVTASRLIYNIRKMSFLATRERKYRQLFNVTELFNSTMDSQEILDGIMEAIGESYPSFEVELLLSHDQKKLTHSYKMFDYMNERPLAIDAFISGEVTVEDLSDSSTKLVNIPIKGRQGIYGVLQIHVPYTFSFTGTQRNFIRMLANTAGSALENASLYDQSHRLIEDLQLVNETSHKLNSDMHFTEMISFLKGKLIRAFKPSEIAFVFFKEKELDISQISTDYFLHTTGFEYIEFASNHLKKGKESLFDANFSSTVKKTVPFESVIAIPITNQENVVGFVICVHENRYFFSFESFKLMQSLIGHSSLALTNSMLRDQLQELANKDHLTKLYARRYLDKVIEQSIENQEGGVLLLLDIDDFKKVNDTHGHETGDLVLKQVSSYILSQVQGQGIAARWGGEELAAYFPGIADEEGERLALHLIKNIPLVSEPSVTVSGGLNSWSSEQVIEFKELFRSADEALYIAKNSGKNQLVISNTSSMYN